MQKKLKWGILSTGRIAGAFARGLATSKSGELVAVGSRSQASADRFGEEFGVSRRYGSYEALLADPDVEAVYIAVPHPFHAEWSIKAADAGKHILCEKPLTLNYPEAMAVVEAAVRNDVFLMEAFMYRCTPQTAKLVELIREKVIGEVRLIQANFAFHAAWQPEGRLLNNALGGGGILDVGCYCTSMARLIAGAALGRDFAEPIEVKGAAHIGETRVDEWAVASLKFPGGIVAQLATGVQLALENVVRVYGTEGHILIPSPWFGAREAGTVSFQVKRKDEPRPREVTVEYYTGPYAMEADVVAANLEKRQASPPAMTWDDSLGNMKTLDRWREAIGLVYDRELPEAWTLPVSGQPLRRRPGHPMRYGTIAGLEKPISRLVMGSMAQNSIAYASVMYDDFVERGGTAFDTAWIYGGGRSEALLGQWIKNRGNREEVVILGKGAHTPFCDPQSLTRQLYESLERLQTDYVDIYLMHRDNPEVPVGEFIDVLNEHQRAGRMRLFGVSNWTLERVDAANAYAQAKGLMGIACVSNNFSLARMVAPVWEGCVASSDPESRAWFQRTQMPLMAWSSQARGFFVRGRRDFTADRGLATCWYSDDNFERLERAKKLAAELGVLPTNVALAYVLCQPFPTYALVGPQSLAETRTTMPALNITLTPRQMRWLNLEE